MNYIILNENDPHSSLYCVDHVHFHAFQHCKVSLSFEKKNCIIHEIEYLHGFLVPFKLPFSLDFGFLVCYLVDASVNVIKIQNGGAGHRIL